jgi:hypothetical protein
MAEHPNDLGVVSAWIEDAADARVGPVGAQHAAVTKRSKPPSNKRYYRGAIYPGGPETPIRIVVRTLRHAGPVAALRSQGWEVEVKDPGTTGAPRVWVGIPHSRANPAVLAELVPLLAVWDAW